MEKNLCHLKSLSPIKKRGRYSKANDICEEGRNCCFRMVDDGLTSDYWHPQYLATEIFLDTFTIGFNVKYQFKSIRWFIYSWFQSLIIPITALSFPIYNFPCFLLQLCSIVSFLHWWELYCTCCPLRMILMMVVFQSVIRGWRRILWKFIIIIIIIKFKI